MTLTKKTVADKIAAYLHHEITLAQLVDWSERALMDGELAERDASTISSVIARLGVADVRAFGLAWEDCEELLRKLGFTPRVEVVAPEVNCDFLNGFAALAVLSEQSRGF